MLRNLRKKRIDWHSGASTILFYICLMFIIVVAFLFFVELYTAFSESGTSQIYADIMSDGTTFLGDNGWGLDEDEADTAFETLTTLNEGKVTGSQFEGYDVTGEYIYVDSNGENSSQKSTDNEDVYNAVHSTSQKIESDYMGTMTNKSTTRITYSGGMKIVLEAWHHTYQYLGSEDGQSHYVYGAGHWGDESEWLQFADCSGFVDGVYRACGYDVSSSYLTYDLEDLGYTVAEGSGSSVFDNAQPGDVILFWYEGSAHRSSKHTGIYAGKYKGQDYMIHCSGPGQTMTYENAGGGESSGAVLKPISYSSYSHIKIQRVVDATGTAYQTSTSIPGLSDDEAAVYKSLKERGYSDVAISALLGNLRYESAGGHSWRIQGHYSSVESQEEIAYAEAYAKGERSETTFAKDTIGGGGYGLAQWTSENRKRKLYQFSSGNVSDLSAQIRLIVWELEVGEPGYSYVYVGNYLKNFANDPERINSYTDYVLRHYEGIFDSSYTRRRENARNIYNAIQRAS